MGVIYNPCQVKTILNKIAHSDMRRCGDYALSPYVGCGFNCYPCTAAINEKLVSGRGRDFFFKILAKSNAPFLLYNQLCDSNKKFTVYFSLTGDPYQKGEEKYKITRSCLEILRNFSIPVHIKTKSDLIRRDLDLIKEIGQKSKSIVSIAIPVISPRLKKIFEPSTPDLKNKISLIKKLKKMKITCGVIIDPLLPYITDYKEMEKIIRFAQSNGVSYIYLQEIILEDYKKKRFFEFLKKHYQKYIAKYQVLFQRRNKPLSHYYKSEKENFLQICKKHKISTQIPIGK